MFISAVFTTDGDGVCTGGNLNVNKVLYMSKLSSIIVKRRHGLGNVILLLPVLDYLHDHGVAICLVTREEWVEAFRAIRPHFAVVSQTKESVIDLDSMTSEIYPSQHRSDELAGMLGIDEQIASLIIDRIPPAWSQSFADLRDGIIFAPEAQHAARCWPVERCRQVKELYPEEQLVLVGTERAPAIGCDVDLRGQLSLPELFGVLSVGKLVVSMDSAILHIAAALLKPTVAIFGGVDVRFRIRPDQPVVALQSSMDCCPCNKREDCISSYDCIQAIPAEHVYQAGRLALETQGYIDFYRAIDLCVSGIQNYTSQLRD